MGLFVVTVSTLFVVHSQKLAGRYHLFHNTMTTKASVLQFLDRECNRGAIFQAYSSVLWHKESSSSIDD